MYVSLMERKGRREGRKEGLKRGLEKGLKKGLEKGLLKGKLAAARKMLAQGEPDEKILYVTEITPDQLEGLRRERVSG